MIIQRFKIPKYNWKVVVLHNITAKDETVVIKALEEICDNPNDIEKAKHNIRANNPNNGFIYSNFDTKQSLIVIGYASSSSEYVDTIIHEANHLQSHIATVFNLDEKGEDVCYLIAYIVKTIYKDFVKIISN